MVPCNSATAAGKLTENENFILVGCQTGEALVEASRTDSGRDRRKPKDDVGYMDYKQYEAKHMTDQGGIQYSGRPRPRGRVPKLKQRPSCSATALYPARVMVMYQTSRVTSCVASVCMRFSAFCVRVAHVPSDVERRVLLALSAEGRLETTHVLLTSIPREGTPHIYRDATSWIYDYEHTLQAGDRLPGIIDRAFQLRYVDMGEG
ncbi:hypothetical protein BJV74DRAFT_794446 [Russula compacta]|nr:hypothetical protein BJV74DRAFT_794446 [Russula compacta]